MEKKYKIIMLVTALSLLSLLSAYTSEAQFITKWKTTSARKYIKIPTTGSGYKYNVDWGDGSSITHHTQYATHQYITAGTYTVSITGTFPRIYFRGVEGDKQIIEISQWGNNAWTSMSGAFYNCSNLNVTATDTPVLTGVTDMSEMFYLCSNLNPIEAAATALNNWNTTNVINMNSMFFRAKTFNQNIGNWNTISVNNMSNMFGETTFFNQNLDSWNTGQVKNMSLMFYNATSFNEEIGSWNTGAVTDMSRMFDGAIAFNKNIGGWNTSAVTNMADMFYNATSFNQDIGSWNTAAVTDMSRMFYLVISFNQNIGNWNTGSVKDMSNMFAGTAFNQNIGDWNTSNVNDMWGMFNSTTSFNQDISNWNTGSVNNMASMFGGAIAFNQNLGNWNTASVSSMYGMFYKATSFNQDIGSWDTHNVDDMGHMFEETTFNQNIGNWNTGNVKEMWYMFQGATTFNQNIKNWNTRSVKFMNNMFTGATAFDQNIGGWNIRNVTGMNFMLDNSGLSILNYDSTLIGWAEKKIQSNVKLSALNLKYCAGADARTALTTTYGWEISGDALSCVTPVELINFTVQKSGTNMVQINWASGVESNIASMSVQRSNNATQWESIYTCSPKGSNSKYEAYDAHPVTGDNYYRLHTKDQDGSEKYSDLRLINFPTSLSPNVYPNPTTGSLTISNIRTGDMIILTDVTGRQMVKKQALSETEKLDIHSLAQGMYFISIMRDGKIVVKDKVTKQ